PAAMSLYEPLEVDVEGRHRMDLLGWYQQFVDLGWHVDILHPQQVAAGALADYRHLVVPTHSLYDLGDNTAMESAVKEFVAGGGRLFHGPHCELVRRAFGIKDAELPFDCLQWREAIIPHGWSTVSFKSGRALARYLQSDKTGIAETAHGKGRIYSFGFQYGYAYCRRTMPIVPPSYGKSEMHPVVLLHETPVAALAGTSPSLPVPPVKGLEFARFGNRLVVVNHRSRPVDLRAIRAGKAIHQVPAAPGWLAAHSAVCLELPAANRRRAGRK
ncbi:MAG TPA: hypothetical protein VFV81_09090, partial [Verrucomicrobiae bacterium]|nr:hypothetical protein [Verrucomicrobiae bacterium]